ncbi:MAG: hypothetical protein ACKOC5_18825 [Chloroflexota bacterium]
MNPNTPISRSPVRIILPFLLLAGATLACTVNFGTPGGSGASQDQSLQFTQTSVSLQMTALALQNSQLNVTQTAAAAAVAQPQLDLPATQAALAAQLTSAAPVLPIMLDTPVLPTERPPEATQPPAQPPAQPEQPAPASGDFKQWMNSASILVYEDIVVDASETQYVKKTLEGMGLRYKWDGNAQGRLKSDMLAGGPNGPWDLIIIAVEARSEVSGEYFDYLNDALRQGSSVILEAWHLDEVSEGTISPILSRCGVTVYEYFPDTDSTLDVLMYQLGIRHPILEEPNSGLTFTKARDKWLYSMDLGSLMAYTGRGDAQILLGTDAQNRDQDGTLAVCMNGQLILQTFSSHSFPYSVDGPLWENMIYNALRTRFESGG